MGWLVILALTTLPAFAAHTTENYEDRWGGYRIQVRGHGFSSPASGFYPIEVEIENREGSRTFEAFTQGAGLGCAQRIRLNAGQRARLLLLHPVPIMGDNPYFFGYAGFNVRLAVNGGVVDEFNSHISSANRSSSVNTWWVGELDGAALDVVGKALGERWSFTVPYRSSYSSGSASTPAPSYDIEQARQSFLALQPTDLPISWRGLTTGDIVVCPWSALASLDGERRTAIAEWVQSGGVLVAPGAPAFDEARTRWREWTGGNLRKVPLAAEGEAVCGWAGSDLLGQIHALRVDDGTTPSRTAALARWLKWVPPAVGTYLQANADQQSNQLARPGTTTRGWSCLTEDEVPRVLRRSPWLIVGFLSMWVLALFPLQYFWLRQRRHLGWLPFSTLGTSLIWMAAMTNYGIFTQGVGIRSITRTWTWLDQNSHRSVTAGFTALVSGWSRPEGLPLPEGGWFLPSLPPGDSSYRANTSKEYRYNWNTPPRLSGGWLMPRSLECLSLRQVGTVRERLQIERQADGRMKVTNGLGTDILALMIVDPSDARTWGFWGEGLPPPKIAMLLPGLYGKAIGGGQSATVNLVPNLGTVFRTESWFPFDPYGKPFASGRSYLARVAHPRWVNLGFRGSEEEGTQHWVAGLW